MTSISLDLGFNMVFVVTSSIAIYLERLGGYCMHPV